jgi:hypothetical protein
MTKTNCKIMFYFLLLLYFIILFQQMNVYSNLKFIYDYIIKVNYKLFLLKFKKKKRENK